MSTYTAVRCVQLRSSCAAEGRQCLWCAVIWQHSPCTDKSTLTFNGILRNVDAKWKEQSRGWLCNSVELWKHSYIYQSHLVWYETASTRTFNTKWKQNQLNSEGGEWGRCSTPRTAFVDDRVGVREVKAVCAYSLWRWSGSGRERRGRKAELRVKILVSYRWVLWEGRGEGCWGLRYKGLLFIWSVRLMGRYVRLLGAELLLCWSLVKLQRVLGVSGVLGGFTMRHWE